MMMPVEEKTDAQKAEEAAEAAKKAADTPEKPKAPDTSVTPDAAAKAAKEKAESDEPKATRTVTLPEEQILAMQRDIDDLTASRNRSDAEAKRERGRTRRARADLSEARKTALPELQKALTAETIGEAIAKAMREQLAPTDKATIPGLKYMGDGEVTYNGQPIDPDVAELLVQSRQRGDTQSEAVQRLEEGLAKINERFETEDSERDAAKLRETEDRHITRMEEYGVAICDQAFSDYDDNIQELARKVYYADQGRVLQGLYERGVNPEQITPELISRIGQPFIEQLEHQFEGIAPKGQKTKADEAREKAPLKRGGSAAEPGRPEFEKMTPEEQEASLDKLATELASTHKIGSGRPKAAAGSGRLNY